MDRHQNAQLSPNELHSLQRIATDPKRPIPSGHREMLLSMKLLQTDAGQLNLSSAGIQRLRDDQLGPMRRTRELWLGRFGRFGF
jgi:hypothetical protein